MSDPAPIPPTPQGEALFEELLWVHGMIRRDLEVVLRLAREVLDGLPAAELREELRRLETNGPLWRLKVNCLHYCRFVHGHHHHEDVLMFPMLRAENPALGPVVDKLEADHRVVAGQLDEVEAAAGALGDGASAAARERVSSALAALAEHLLEHLRFEEEQAGPTLRGMSRHPFAV